MRDFFFLKVKNSLNGTDIWLYYTGQNIKVKCAYKFIVSSKA